MFLPIPRRRWWLSYLARLHAGLRPELPSGRRRARSLRFERLEDRVAPAVFVLQSGDSFSGALSDVARSTDANNTIALAHATYAAVDQQIVVAAGHALTIVGQGAGTVLSAAQGVGRVLEVDGNVALQDLTVEGGNLPVAAGQAGGAGLLIDGGQVTLSNVTVRSNRAQGAAVGSGAGTVAGGADPRAAPTVAGGGIYLAGGSLKLVDAVVAGNQVLGGHGGNATKRGANGVAGAAGVGHSAAGNANNGAPGGAGGPGGRGGDGGAALGGGMYVAAGTVTIQSSQLRGNTCVGGAGGQGASGGAGGAGGMGASGHATSRATPGGGAGGMGGQGGSGGPGGAGGAAAGAGLYAASGTIAILASELDSNHAQGGAGAAAGAAGAGGAGANGGPGGTGTLYGPATFAIPHTGHGGAGGSGGTGGAGGLGGAGGAADGGGCYLRTGTLTLSNTGLDSNRALGGAGGPAAHGGAAGSGGAGGAGGPGAVKHGGTTRGGFSDYLAHVHGGAGGAGGPAGFGGRGGAGGTGGSAAGGGIYQASGRLLMFSADLRSSLLEGGPGGAGGAAAPGAGGGAGAHGVAARPVSIPRGTGHYMYYIPAGPGGAGGAAGPGGAGGRAGPGGAASGGGLDAAGAALLLFRSTVTLNQVVGGSAGGGGPGGAGGLGGPGGGGGTGKPGATSSRSATKPGGAGGAGGSAGNGGAGESGGSAAGGGCFITGGSVALVATDVTADRATGGAGGPGGNAGQAEPGQPGATPAGPGGKGGAGGSSVGGNGGSAAGGALTIGNDTTVRGGAIDGTVTGGAGGNAGSASNGADGAGGGGSAPGLNGTGTALVDGGPGGNAGPGGNSKGGHGGAVEGGGVFVDVATGAGIRFDGAAVTGVASVAGAGGSAATAGTAGTPGAGGTPRAAYGAAATNGTAQSGTPGQASGNAYDGPTPQPGTSAAVTQLYVSPVPAVVLTGVPLPDPVYVVALDANGKPVPSFTGDVTLTLPSPEQPVRVNAVGGVVTFSGLVLRRNVATATLPASSGPVQGVSNAFTVVGYTPAQLRAAYGLNALPAAADGHALDGSGRTIAIVGAYNDPNLLLDVDHFDQQFGLTTSGPTLYQQYGPAASFLKVYDQNPQNLTTIDPASASVSADPVGQEPAGLNAHGLGNAAVEEIMDVEWAHTIAPGATIDVIEANSTARTDLYTAIGKASLALHAAVVSYSYGSNGELASEDLLDRTFQVPGVVFVAASGDDGANHFSYPAASPYVLAVGGTSLTLNLNSSYASEAAWNGSGGGLSTQEPEPTYQRGVVPHDPKQTRAVPDVAFAADPATPVAVYDSYNNAPATAWASHGFGTSLGTPCWAALIALVDQGLQATGAAPLNHADATQTLAELYTLARSHPHDFHTLGGGYNLATGLGSPAANLLVPDLIHFAGIGLLPTTLPPAVVGTKFTQAFTGTGSGTGYHFTATGLPLWLTLSAAGWLSGTPPANAPASVAFTVTVTDAAHHTASVPYTLAVEPAIVISPAGVAVATVGDSFTVTLSATGGSGTGYAFAISAGSLPRGLTLAGAAIQGTPLVAGTLAFTVTAADSNGALGQRAYALHVDAALVLGPATTTLPVATVANAYNQPLTVTGGSGKGYTIALAPGSHLPPGLRLSATTIIGMPTTPGSYSFTLVATDSIGATGSRAYALTVDPPIVLNPTALPAATVGTRYGQVLTASGGTGKGYTFKASGLPSWLSLTSTGKLTGTPLAKAAGSVTFTVTATDSNRALGSMAYTLTITA